MVWNENEGEIGYWNFSFMTFVVMTSSEFEINISPLMGQNYYKVPLVSSSESLNHREHNTI